jgi:hypothetical protein
VDGLGDPAEVLLEFEGPLWIVKQLTADDWEQLDRV